MAKEIGLQKNADEDQTSFKSSDSPDGKVGVATSVPFFSHEFVLFFSSESNKNLSECFSLKFRLAAFHCTKSSCLGTIQFGTLIPHYNFPLFVVVFVLFIQFLFTPCQNSGQDSS